MPMELGPTGQMYHYHEECEYILIWNIIALPKFQEDFCSNAIPHIW